MDIESIDNYQLEKPEMPESALNFEFLRAKGIELVQRYAGKKWTDYNLHDPGVTILEYLCYAITDLGYRSGFDIKDILAGKNGVINAEQNLFFPKHTILTSKPVLINDFRKWVIDQVPEVHNVWIIPVTDVKGEEGMKGLYRVLIQVNHEQIDEYLNADIDQETKAAYKKTISEKVRSVILKERSLGEDYHDFLVLDPADVEIEAEVVADRHLMHEEILAEVYDTLVKAITPPVRFYSESQLEKDGWPIEAIYNGPKLRHGFIKDEELKERVSMLDPSDMVQAILNVPGVKYVRNFVIKYQGADYDFRPLYFDAGVFPRLIFDVRNPGIRIFSERYELPLKTSIFSGLLFKKADAGKRKYIKGYGSNEHKQLKGTFRELEAYYSMQHLFPPVYRLNSDEIETDRQAREEENPKVNEEKAKVKQLKAYVMLFEQLMVNYLAQLSNVSGILSAEIGTEGSGATYFTRDLYQVPGAGNILSDFMKAGENRNHVDWDYFIADTENEYQRFLKTSIESEEVFFDRKKRVLDHMLSRFDLNLLKYPLQLYYQMYHQDEQVDHRFAELKWKSDILKNVAVLTAERNHAYDYSDILSDRKSGYDHLLATLLYLPDPGPKSLSRSFEESLRQCNISSSITQKEQSDGRKIVYEVHWDDERLEMLIDETLLANLQSGIDQDAAIEESDIRVPSQRISFLKDGIDPKYYRIGTEVNGKGYVILYRPPEKRQWIRVAKFATREKAHTRLKELIQTLKQISIQSEGFHSIEHVLLRPSLDAPVFGFQLLDERGLLLLQQYKWMPHHERTAVLDEIMNICRKMAETGDVSLLSSLEGLCEINLSQDRLYTWLVSPATLQTAYREQLDQFIRKIMHAIRCLDQNKDVRYPAVKKMICHEKDFDLDEQFFSFNMSVVMPSWPARFQEGDFREFTESLFREYAPAHIRQQFLWLSVQDMKQFESVYFRWLDELREDRNSDTCALLAKEVLTILAKRK